MKRCFAVLGLVVFLTPVWGQTADEKKATIRFLQRMQVGDGGFVQAPARTDTDVPTSGLRATSGGLRALKYFGGEPRDRAAAARFVESCYDPASGGFADRPGGKPDVAVTAVGVMAVAELKLPTAPYETGVLKYLSENAKTFEEIRIAVAGLEALGKKSLQYDAWVKQLEMMRNADGTVGKGDSVARDTGGLVVALLRMGAKDAHAGAVLQALKAGQRKDGGYGKAETAGSDLETTYRVMRCFHMMKAKPDVEKCRAFVASCRNADGGYGAAPGQPSTVTTTYFASIILHWLAE